MRGLLIFAGAVLMTAALVVIVWGIVEVGRGEKGTWDIWPFYVVHGGISLAALILFGIANKGREKPLMQSAGAGEES